MNKTLPRFRMYFELQTRQYALQWQLQESRLGSHFATMTKTEWSFDEVSSSHLWFLRLLGLVPLAGKTLDYFVTKGLYCYFHVINVLYNGMWMGYGVSMVARKELEVEFLCELMVVESVCFRYLMLTFSRKKLVKAVDTCAELWSFVTAAESKVVRSFERKAYFFRTFLLINSIGVVTSFIVTAYFIRIPGPTVNDTERRVLPFRFFVEVYEEPWFTLAAVLQDVVTYSISLEVAGIETVGLYLMMMACGYLRLVRNRLSKIQHRTLSVDNVKKFNDEFEDILSSAILHQKIMLFCQDIEDITRKVFFFTVFTTVYNMSMTGIKILENDENSVKFLTIFSLNLFQFFTVQWGPEYLLIESGAIGEDAYFASTNQSSYDTKSSKVLLLMMMRAQRPFQLTAGGYIRLSIETFGNMVRNAFSFFAVLRSFRS